MEGRGWGGVLTCSFPSGFDRYFSSRTLDNNRRNIWFAEFWEDNFHCKLSRHALKKGSHVKKCTSEHARGRDQDGPRGGAWARGAGPEAGSRPTQVPTPGPCGWAGLSKALNPRCRQL